MAEKMETVLTYKGRPLVRSGNTLYYGDMAERCVIVMQVLTTKTVGDMAVADRVLVMSHGQVAMLDTVQAVFSRAEELERIGLTVPAVTKILLLLRQSGVEVSTAVYTVEQAVEQLLPLLGGDGVC